VAILLPGRQGLAWRAPACAVAALCAVVSVSAAWNRPLAIFDYIQRERAGEISATYSLVPFSPNQRFPELDRQPPMSRLGGKDASTDPTAGRTFILGTDALGSDVLSSLMHACRLAISIGLVSTGIAVTIGVTIGSLMDQARRRNRQKFRQWIRQSTPFQVAEAERLMTVAIAYRDLPAETIRSLPRPSSALTYVFEDVDTRPYESSTSAFSRADLLAGALLAAHPDELSTDVGLMLRAWLCVDDPAATP
jgi:hypothetical protein